MKQILAHTGNYTKGRTRAIDHIVVHYTAGDGDTAANNGNYFASDNRKASAHYFVDATEIVQSVLEEDTAWHAGNWEMNCRSIGVEMCSKKNSAGKYYIPEATMLNAAKLVRQLMERYEIPVSRVLRHYDVTGKNCPAPMVEDEGQWKSFLALTELAAEVVDQMPADWANDAWEKAKASGVLDGTRPLDPVTRQELAVVLCRLGLVK